MHIDSQLLLSDAQALTATGASTNYVDTTNARNAADGEDLEIVIQVDVSADYTTTDETYAFSVETDDNTSFSSVETVVSRTISAASSNLAAGTIHRIPLPKMNERYFRLKATLGGTTPSITFTAWVGKQSMSDKFRTYPAGYTITG